MFNRECSESLQQLNFTVSRISVLYVMYITTGGIWEGEKRISKLSVFIETSEVRRPALICVHDFRWGRFRKIEILF